MKLPNLIGFCGYARSGKDTAAAVLIRDHGFAKYNKGDIIKRQLDELVRRYFGFSAFTEKDEEKCQIRATLEAWGSDNRVRLAEAYFQSLPPRAVSTRIVELEEAREWRRRGGIILCVRRSLQGPETPFAKSALARLLTERLVDGFVENAGTVEDLEKCALQAAHDAAVARGLLLC